MALIRAWYTYNEIVPGGRFNSANYFYVNFFPACYNTGIEVCCVYGIYDDGVNPPYEDHPKPFAVDNRIESYISSAIAANTSYPNGFSQKRYVYVI